MGEFWNMERMALVCVCVCVCVCVYFVLFVLKQGEYTSIQ
jgi:hypothetical protein